MDRISILNLLAVLAIASSGIIFFILIKFKVKEQTTINSFLLSDRSLTGKNFINTFTSSQLSLASNIIFFITYHQEYGYLMGIGPIFYFITHYLILKYLKNNDIDLRDFHTMSDIFYLIFPSKLIARCISLLAGLTCIMGVFVELYIGSLVLSMFLPSTAFHHALSFFFIGLLVIGCVKLGGYKGVILTDGWQLSLIFACLLSISVFALFSPITSPEITTQIIIGKLFKHSESGLPLFMFMVWICTLNVFLCVADLTVWQRIAASKSNSEAYEGYCRGFWKPAFAFFVPIFCCILISAKGYQFNSMETFLSTISESSGDMGYIIYPLIVMGFSAALFSTADTLLVGAIYAFCDNNTLLPKINLMPDGEREKKIKQYLSIFSIIIISILSIFYFIEYNEIGKMFMPILYAVWGMMALVAPLMIYVLYSFKHISHHRSINKNQEITLFVSLALGWIIILITTYLSSTTENHSYSQVGTFAAIFFLLVGIKVISNTKSKKEHFSSIANQAV